MIHHQMLRLITAAILIVAGCSPAWAADVISFTLIDADSDVPIPFHNPLTSGARIDLSSLSNSNINIRADADGAVGSISFNLTGQEIRDQTENGAPYALFGDSSGNYNVWTPAIGSYTLTARSHTASNGGGTAGSDFTVSFEVANGPPPPADGTGDVTISGSLQQWHRVTLALSGPGATETSSPNPFLDYRFNVLFTGPSGQQFDVPGYFAGDGAAEPAPSGNVWHAHLSPNETGTWSYQTSFRHGTDAAVDVSGAAGTPVSTYDGISNTFVVTASTASGSDFRAPGRGLIRNRGGHYLTEADGDPWIKGGPDIPENFLGYDGFDNTPNAGHSFAAHDADWQSGNPEWGGDDRSHGIIGALNFIADRGANSIYFLPMNLGGDGDDTFPTITETDKTRFDLSKLAQWDQVFTHAQSRGIFLHFVLAETEPGNENYHDGGTLGPQRKLYYRMLASRFGHQPGLQWNLGEENDYGTTKREEFAAYLKAVDVYDHPVTTHTHDGQYTGFYGPLLGNADFDITSFQGGNSGISMFDLIVSWRQQSASAGVPWAVSFDEPQKIENDVSDVTSGYPHGRRDKMWPVYMAGGAGFEWYVQQDGGGHSLDQQIDDYNIMSAALSWTGHALDFLSLLPVAAMTADRTLAWAASGNTYTMYKSGEIYALYNDRSGDQFSLDLSAAPAANFTVRWFDPRSGGVLVLGTVTTVVGGSVVNLGSAPADTDEDWAVQVKLEDGVIFADDFEDGDTSAWDKTFP